MPLPDCVIVEIESLRDFLATPAPIQQQNGIGATGQPMLRQTIARQRGQFRPLPRRKKPATNHPQN